MQLILGYTEIYSTDKQIVLNNCAYFDRIGLLIPIEVGYHSERSGALFRAKWATWSEYAIVGTKDKCCISEVHLNPRAPTRRVTRQLE